MSTRLGAEKMLKERTTTVEKEHEARRIETVQKTDKQVQKTDKHKWHKDVGLENKTTTIELRWQPSTTVKHCI